MAFTVLAADTTISVAEVNDNFTHIGQGDLCPRTGTTLTLDDSETSNLGSDVYRWKTIYTTNVNVTGEVEGTMYLVTSVTLSATAAAITISGLNGDDEVPYFIRAQICFDASGTTYFYLHLNADSASNYGHQFMEGYASSSLGTRNTGTGYMLMWSSKITATTDIGHINAVLYAKSGSPRLMLHDAVSRASQRFVYEVLHVGGSWNNTADTVTSMTLQGLSQKFRTGTSINIYSIARI